MAWPYTTLPVDVELYAGHWRDITEHVRRAAGITIAHGETRPGAGAEPSTCALTLMNDGRFSPRNAAGLYYGHLTRRTPIRVLVRPLTDTFDRTVADSWGSVDGFAWSATGAGSVLASDWQVAGGYATHSVPLQNASRMSWLQDHIHEQVDLSVKWSLPGVASVTGARLEAANILVRGVTTGEYYMLRLNVNTAQEITVALYYQDVTPLTDHVLVPGVPYVDGASYWVRLQAEGQVLRAKVWADTTGEPLDWNVSVRATNLPTTGFVGVRSGIEGGNTNTKPVIFRYEEMQVRLPRFRGFVTEWPAEWTPSAAFIDTEVTAVGGLALLQREHGPPKSALRRYLERTDPYAYYPLDDEKGATSGRNVVNPAQPATQMSIPPEWGGQSPADWLEPGVRHVKSVSSTLAVASGIEARMTMPFTVGAPQQLSIDLVFAARAGDPALSGFMQIGVDFKAVFNVWTISLDADTLGVDTRWGGGAGLVSTPGFFDGKEHHIRFHAEQVGSGIDWVVYLDGEDRLSNTEPLQTLFPVTRSVRLTNYTVLNGGELTQAHLAIWTDPPDLAEVVDAVRGHTGEAAGRRVERILAEQVLEFVAMGDLDDTQILGPQPLNQPAGVVDAAVIADGGNAYDSRGGSIAYRPLRSMYNQAPTVELDYAAPGHLAPGLRPVEDDLVVNDVTATRMFGSSEYATRADGPMGTDTIGLRDASVSPNLASQNDTAQLANWQVGRGTYDGPRYSPIVIRLHDLAGQPGGYELAWAAAGLDLFDRLLLTNLPAFHRPGYADQLAAGIIETIDLVEWTLQVAGIPAEPYSVFEVENEYTGRLHLDGQTLVGSPLSTAGNIQVATAAGKPLLTTDPADLPMRIVIAGAELDVTAVVGAASPQTLTVTLANGVVKQLPAGSPVELAQHSVVAY